jgi:hypothetical protein
MFLSKIWGIKPKKAGFRQIIDRVIKSIKVVVIRNFQRMLYMQRISIP